MQQRTIVMVPGYNEPPAHFETLANGDDGIPGLRSHGFDCVTFDTENDTLSDRIDQFAKFIERMKVEGRAFPLILLGYSLGGLVVRGFMRRFPERSHAISRCIMISTPNWGVVTLAMPFITAMLRVPDKSMGDMTLDSPFMHWLNGTGGRWQRDRHGRRIWVLDQEPWLDSHAEKMHVIMGLIPPRGGDNDGLVWGDSATLGSRIRAHYVIGPHANHMNIIGHFDPLIMLTRGFLRNDRVWPLTLNAILSAL